MFGKSSRVNPLESRRQLLVAESDLNRAQLLEDMAALASEVRTFTDRAQSVGSIASSAAVLVAGLAAYRGRKPEAVAVKPSWLQTLLIAARLACSIWLVVRPPSAKANR